MLEQLADVVFCLGPMAADGLDFGYSLGEQTFIDIAQIGHADAGHLCELAIVRASAAAEADHSDVDGVVWAALSQGGLCCCHAGPDGSGLEEGSAAGGH